MRPDVEKNRIQIEELKGRLIELSAASPDAFPELLFGVGRNCHSEKAIYLTEEGEDHILLSGKGKLLRCQLLMYTWLLIPSYIPQDQGQINADQDYAKYGQKALSTLRARVNLVK